MAIHSQKDIDKLVERLQLRHDKLVAVMRGKPMEQMTNAGPKPGVVVDADDIWLAIDDVAAALKLVKTRLGKG